ncbi:hypothetical protein [Hymenobacter rubidus]|uniref:hypothetical protein n=1 Tax=Hymenobacter rubidus TaxID=1441626 RepID=UPI00191E7489|nr:hypothetical protein [Hymenobacter rubidus]
MNKLLPLFAGLLLLAAPPCIAQNRLLRPAAYADEHAEPRVDSVRLQTTALTAYITDMLRLSRRQQVAVQRCVGHHLAQLDSLHWQPAGTLPVCLETRDALTRQYYAALHTVLTPSQNRSFLLLKEYQPLAEPNTSWLAVDHR